MIYITGATGRIGELVLKKLPNAIPLVRKKSKLKREIVVDFNNLEELKKVLKNAKAVIHLAASRDFFNHKVLWEVNVKLTKRLIQATPKKAKFIFASSISVYGKRMAKVPANEKTKLLPDTPYAKSKVYAEEEVKKHKNHVILRIGTVYGPKFKDYFVVLRMLKKGKMKILGNGDNRIPFVNGDDVATVIKNSTKKGKGVYVVSGPAKTQLEIFKIATKLLKVKMPTYKVSPGMALLFAQMEEIKAKLSKKHPKITREHILVLSSNRDYNCSKAKKQLGFKPRSIESGIKEMVEAYKKK